MAKFGLIGKNIDYSFSKKFFTEKFEKEQLPHSYENFDINAIELFPELISKNPTLKGVNVTIPYKEEILPFLDDLDEDAKQIGAVNTIKFTKNKLIGYNTDHFGFQKALEKFLPLHNKKALILGTGGASKAVAFALNTLGFEYQFVSRKENTDTLKYDSLSKESIENHFLIINCTPLGTFPNIADCPPIPYQYITKHHLLFDLIYNPAETEFLKRGKNNGALIVNGLDMLRLQAEKAWEIWNR